MINVLRELLAIVIQLVALWGIGLGVVALVVGGIEFFMRAVHYLLGDRR